MMILEAATTSAGERSVIGNELVMTPLPFGVGDMVDMRLKVPPLGVAGSSMRTGAEFPGFRSIVHA